MGNFNRVIQIQVSSTPNFRVGILGLFHLVFIFGLFFPKFCAATNFLRNFTKYLSKTILREFFPKYCPATNYLGIFTKYLSSDQFFRNFFQNIVQ